MHDACHRLHKNKRLCMGHSRPRAVHTIISREIQARLPADKAARPNPQPSELPWMFRTKSLDKILWQTEPVRSFDTQYSKYLLQGQKYPYMLLHNLRTWILYPFYLLTQHQ